MAQAQAVPNQRSTTKTLPGFGRIMINQYEFRLDIVLVALQLTGVRLPVAFPIKAGEESVCDKNSHMKRKAHHNLH
jgi:hypothetical protein